MKLYEIDQRILDLIDPETGEVMDLQAMMDLQMAREEKIEGLALHVKNLKAESEAIKAEIKTLTDRKKALDNKAESAEKFLSEQLAGEKFQTARVAVSFRKSEGVLVEDDFTDWALANDMDHLLTFAAPKPNLTEIKKAIKAGEDVSHAVIEQRSSISIK